MRSFKTCFVIFVSAVGYKTADPAPFQAPPLSYTLWGPGTYCMYVHRILIVVALFISHRPLSNFTV